MSEAEKKFVVAIDQGTTSSRSIVFDSGARIVAVEQKEFTQLFPVAGWVEHDPLEIWNSQCETLVGAIRASGVTPGEIAAVGITNQRETTVLWDRATGEPVMNAIVWQDRRTAEFCNAIRESHGEAIRLKTGLEVDAYFSASKIRWILDNISGVRERAERGEIAFGTVDSWLVYRLTSGKTHITDVSNASRTMLFNIRTLDWDEELLEIFAVPRAMLPRIVSSSEIVGEVDAVEELRGVKIAGIAGDQQAALFGQLCLMPGMSKNTYGTGCFMLQNVGGRPVLSTHRLLTTVAWRIDGVTEYALEGSVFIGGAVVQWLRDSLGIIGESGDVEALANSVEDSAGVYFVPAFAGLGAPYWDQEARGTIVGLTRGSGRAHIARAAIEAICYQTADVLEAMKADGGVGLTELRVDGGAAINDSLLQFQADLLGIPVIRPAINESTALGAAFLAGLATGVWASREALREFWREEKRFKPSLSADKVGELKAGWRKAVGKARM